MKLLALPLVVIGLVLAFTLAGPIQQRIEDSNAHARTLAALQAEREAFDLGQHEQFQVATQPGQITSDYMFRALSAIAAAGLLYLVYDLYRARQRRVDDDRRLVYPNQAGYLPAPRAALERGELVDLLADAMRAAGVAQIEAARRPNVPAALTFSPHYSARNDLAALPDAMDAPALATVPTFAQMLDHGRIGKGNPLVLGFDEATGAEISGTWLDLYSTIVAGMSGSGKTTSQRFLACQTALQGAKFAVIDPHAGAAADSLAATLQPLSSAFVCEPASTDKAILDVVRYVADVGRRRIEGKDSSTVPLILWADELTALLGRSAIADELAQLLERIAQEYRKRHVFVCGSGQIFTASRATSELRDSFASVVCHRMKRGQARLLLPTEEAAVVERLETGHAVLWRTSGATSTISVPNTTGMDVRRVADLLTDSQPTMPRVTVIDQPEVSHAAAPDYSAPQRVKTLSPEAARVVALFLEGKDAGAIVTELSGLTSKAGQPYMRKLSEVQAAIRVALAGQVAA